MYLLNVTIENAGTVNKHVVGYNNLLNICRTRGKGVFKELDFDTPLVDNFYDVPHFIPLPEIEAQGLDSAEKPPDPLLTQPSKLKYLDVRPHSLPCLKGLLLVRDEYTVAEDLIANHEGFGDIAIIGAPGIGLTFRHLT